MIIRFTLGFGTKTASLTMTAPAHPCARGISASLHVAATTCIARPLRRVAALRIVAIGQL